MKGIIKWFDSCPKWLKIIFALPVLDIVWAVYRLARSISKKSVIGIILGILMLIFCPAIFWIVDIITIALTNRVIWIN